jgi:hypothetical protein
MTGGITHGQSSLGDAFGATGATDATVVTEATGVGNDAAVSVRFGSAPLQARENTNTIATVALRTVES